MALSISILGLAACAKYHAEENPVFSQCEDSVCEERALNEAIESNEIIDAEFEANYPVDLEPLSYDHIDPEHVIPARALENALTFFQANLDKFPNKKFMSIFDISQHSSQRRLYLVDLVTGKVSRHIVAHGRNSDPDADGYATQFSNEPGSKKSSLGFYKTAETYSGNHGYSLRLDGLSATNSNARSRAVVIHGAAYVSEEQAHAGRSWGCPAVDQKFHKEFIDKIRFGSLLYIYQK